MKSSVRKMQNAIHPVRKKNEQGRGGLPKHNELRVPEEDFASVA
jgi:hypothetical protein